MARWQQQRLVRTLIARVQPARCVLQGTRRCEASRKHPVGAAAGHDLMPERDDASLAMVERALRNGPELPHAHLSPADDLRDPSAVTWTDDPEKYSHQRRARRES